MACCQCDQMITLTDEERISANHQGAGPLSRLLGTRVRNNSSRFAPSSTERKLTPVILPLGRLRLATRPDSTGSLPIAKTIGIVVVAALAARAAGIGLATITATRRLTRSAANIRCNRRGAPALDHLEEGRSVFLIETIQRTNLPYHVASVTFRVRVHVEQANSYSQFQSGQLRLYETNTCNFTFPTMCSMRAFVN